MRMRYKALCFAGLAACAAAGGYIYLARVLKPVSPAIACPSGQLDGWRCASYQIIVSKPFFVLAGAFVGAWFAYALIRLYAAPGSRSFTAREGLVAGPPLLAVTAWIIALHPGITWFWGDSLGWWQVLLFFLVAVLVRLAIAVASVANVRGGLILGFGMPIIFAGVGYAAIRLFQLAPVGHSCPPGAPASACVYQPIIGKSGPWVILGLLAGTWLAYAVAAGLGGLPRGLNRKEYAIVLPIMTGLIWWALVVGPDQAGGGYVGRFVFGVCLAALLRLLLGMGGARSAVSGVLAKLGIVARVAAAPTP